MSNFPCKHCDANNRNNKHEAIAGGRNRFSDYVGPMNSAEDGTDARPQLNLRKPSDGPVMLQRYTKSLALLVVASCSTLPAAERPTLDKTTRDPRPNIIPHPLYDAHVEYRRRYNRPRYVGGWIASVIAPSSQEAMVWCENVRAGAYDKKHTPARYKRYFAPKPWEVLQTGPRPDFPKSEDLSKLPTPELNRPIVQQAVQVAALPKEKSQKN